MIPQEQLRAKIKDYPALGLPEHPEKSPDVDSLRNAQMVPPRSLGGPLSRSFAKGPSPLLFQADTDLSTLTGQGDRWPKEIEVYWAVLNSRLDLSLMARAQNRCLLQGGQLLQRLKALFQASAALEDLTALERLR